MGGVKLNILFIDLLRMRPRTKNISQKYKNYFIYANFFIKNAQKRHFFFYSSFPQRINGAILIKIYYFSPLNLLLHMAKLLNALYFVKIY